MTSIVEPGILDELQYYKNELNRLWGSHYSFDQIMGSSLLILEAKRRAWNIAATQSPILLCGEKGTGKTLFAHAIHHDSPQKEGPFIIINCQTKPDDAKRELLGEKSSLAGLFNMNNKPIFISHGTVVLQEVTSLPEDIQNQLAEAIQKYDPGDKTRSPLPRLIATTNQVNKIEMTASLTDSFKDLIADYIIKLPPLRSRLEDIPAISHRFINDLNQIAGTAISGLSDAALDLMMQYSWPDNVNELKTIVDQAGLDAQTGVINVENLYLLKSRLDDSRQLPSLKESVMRAEKEAILKALAYSKGNKKLASEVLGITRTSLYNKLKELDIDV